MWFHEEREPIDHKRKLKDLIAHRDELESFLLGGKIPDRYKGLKLRHKKNKWVTRVKSRLKSTEKLIAMEELILKSNFPDDLLPYITLTSGWVTGKVRMSDDDFYSLFTTKDPQQ